jgi:uncharacterized protein with HEPN domain
LLEDIRQSCVWIEKDIRGLSSADYETNRRVCQIVERNLIIIGEAMSRLDRADPETATRITDFQLIIGLRHRLAHGYDEDIDDPTIWRTVTIAIPILQAEVESLIDEGTIQGQEG